SSRSFGTPAGKWSSSTRRTCLSASRRIRWSISRRRLRSSRERRNSWFRPSLTATRLQLLLLHGGTLDLELHLGDGLPLLLQHGGEGGVARLVAQPAFVQIYPALQDIQPCLGLLVERPLQHSFLQLHNPSPHHQ